MFSHGRRVVLSASVPGANEMKMLSAIVALIVPVTCAQVAFANDLAFVFATVEQGRDTLTKRDDFVQRMSPFDRAARMKTDKTVSEETYLKFVSSQVLEWTEDEKAALQAILSDNLGPLMGGLGLPWPAPIYIIKTTGQEEGNAPYTRGNAIVLPLAELAKGIPIGKTGPLRGTIAHELFHILSRHNPALKERLYAAIGFQSCGEVAFPSSLAAMKITNPDAPKNDHCIRVRIGGKEAWVVPILFSKSEKYDVGSGGEFFNYLQLRFLRVDGTGAQAPRVATYNDTEFQLVDVSQLSGFFEQVGRNTDYIIHPEEILAENFSFLVLGKTGLPSPETLKNIKGVLEQARSNEAR
jgi:hypothetical protein